MVRPEQVHLKSASLVRLDGDRPNLGSSESAHWVCVSGWQGAPRNARIILDNPTLDSIDAFIMDGPRVLGRFTAGAAFGREKDLIPTFNLPLNEAHQLWFRVRSTKPVLLPFSLIRADEVEVLRERRDLAVALIVNSGLGRCRC